MSHTYGIELEVTSIQPATASAILTRGGIACNMPSRSHETADHWKAVYDGSVNGAEVVSPILTNDRLNEVSQVARLLAGNGAKVNATTGYHCHIGVESIASDENQRLNTLANLVVNWYAQHDFIGMLVAPSRLNNRYCKSVSALRAEQNAENIRNGSISDVGGDRYQSLNLMSYQRHGTIEIRLHQGTLNGTKAVAWAEFISAMINRSADGIINGAEGDRLNGVKNLLDCLSLDGYLKESTAIYLKSRAEALNG